MTQITLFYGIEGFFGNALCNKSHVLGAMDIEADDTQTAKEVAETVVNEKTDWDWTHWDAWRDLETFNNRKQVSRHSQIIKGRCPQYQWIQNYIQFVLLVFEDNNNPSLREQYLGKEKTSYEYPCKS